MPSLKYVIRVSKTTTSLRMTLSNSKSSRSMASILGVGCSMTFLFLKTLVMGLKEEKIGISNIAGREITSISSSRGAESLVIDGKMVIGHGYVGTGS